MTHEPGDPATTRIRGHSICPGVGIGRAVVLDREPEVARTRVDPARVEAEIARYEDARVAARVRLREHIAQAHGGSWLIAEQILGAHEAILDDEGFHAAVRSRISDEAVSAPWALEIEAENVIAQLEASRSPYLEARAEDIRDLVRALFEILAGEPTGGEGPSPGSATDAPVCVSGHLFPSQVIDAKRRSSAAFATESSALLSHAAILLKGFGIPSLGGVRGLRGSVRDGDLVVVDATNEIVIVRPDRATIQKYEAILEEAAAEQVSSVPAPRAIATRDGVAIRLMGNIDNPAQMGLVLKHRLQGVGLFRTEFMILEAGRVPSEQEQYETYRRVLDAATGVEVVIRTFDLGADKQLPELQRCKGQNPALGIRGIRRHLRVAPDELRTQMRAICRAASTRRVSIMAPMVTTVDEVRELREHLKSVQDDLLAEGEPSPGRVRLGVMIEVPAAALAIGEILHEVDFVSIGSNDLLQYFMASDRDNESTVEYLDAENPGFLKLLGFMARQARELGREEDLTICGEIASQPRLVPRLLRLGFRSLSVSPLAADAVRSVIGSIEIAGETLRSTPEDETWRFAVDAPSNGPKAP
jgi:phosphotransferase system enzyme I (PtsI)